MRSEEVVKKDNSGLGAVFSEVAIILVGELIVSLITAGVFLLLDVLGTGIKLDHTVVLGLLLGTVVTVANFLILALTVNNAVNKALANAPKEEMTEEEAIAFAEENRASVQMAAAGTYIIRTLLMLGALVGAFLIGNLFNVVATLIPLVMYRPIIFVSEFIRKKKGGAA